MTKHDPESAQSGAAAAEARLAELGYKQELPRSLSYFSILGLSFAIMAVPFGLSTTLSIGLTDGGPVTILWGWVLVTLISIAIAASLAEICSTYPTSGGVYYWSAMLSTPKYAPIASWVTGWLGLVGNWLITTSICFSGGQLILSAISLWDEAYVPKAWQIVLMYWAVLLVALAVNIWGAKYLDQLNTACVYWTGASVIILLVTLLVMAPSRRSASFVFGHYDPSPSGWAPGWAFFVGLLQAAYTLTGYGMVAAMCEEVQNPEREVPRAMVMSVVAAGVTGLFYLIPILFVLPDIQELLSVATGQPAPLLFKLVTGSAGGGFGLLFLILGILFFAGVGALTASSRCAWAFARDGAIPGSRWWAKANERYDIPLNALFLSTVFCGLLGLIYLGSSAAFNAFTGVGTICLSASYAFPIFVSLLRGRHAVRNASFSLGTTLGTILNAITCAWILLAIVLFTMPTAIPVTKTSMNYASVLFAFFGVVSAGWYAVWGRKYYVGPRSHLEGEAVGSPVIGRVEKGAEVRVKKEERMGAGMM
ncbi:hypothetical protein YB2330_004811 [Saitoella coloradoensis]